MASAASAVPPPRGNDDPPRPRRGRRSTLIRRESQRPDKAGQGRPDRMAGRMRRPPGRARWNCRHRLSPDAGGASSLSKAVSRPRRRSLRPAFPRSFTPESPRRPLRCRVEAHSWPGERRTPPAEARSWGRCRTRDRLRTEPWRRPSPRLLLRTRRAAPDDLCEGRSACAQWAARASSVSPPE